MDRLIYTAMSGLTDSMTRQSVIASNMANAQTVGFKAEVIYSTPVTLKGPSLEARAMTQGQVHGADMKAGSVEPTGQPLDIALQGNALLAVQAPDGSEAYTRRGDLSVTSTGILQNGEGLPVIGSGGPITVPPGATVSIAPDGSVMLSTGDVPGQAPQVLDKLKLVNPAGSSVQKGLNGLFEVTGGGVLPADETAKVQPGALEQSNVDPNAVLVDMLSAQRLFEIRTKLLSTAKDIDQSGASLMNISASS